MFKIPKVNVIESDSGFSVEVLGRTGMLYCEHGRKMKIDSEVLMGTKAMVIYIYSISKWLSPHEAELVDENTRQHIINNIRDAFLFSGVEVGFE